MGGKSRHPLMTWEVIGGLTLSEAQMMFAQISLPTYLSWNGKTNKMVHSTQMIIALSSMSLTIILWRV